MKIKGSNYLLWFVASLLCIAAVASIASPGTTVLPTDFILIKEDTIKKDTTKNQKYKPSRRPIVNPSDRYGNPMTERSKSPLLLPNPSNVTTEVQLDTGNNYYIEEKVGDTYYRAPSTMTLDEYSKMQQQNYMRNYWKTKSQGLDGESAVSGRGGVIPKLYIGPGFDRIFGGNYVDIQPNGFVSLDFGMRGQRVNNPAYSIRQQRTPLSFEFDQQINMNVTGKIGEKATITSNFDTKSSFQFENQIKFEYTGFEEDIIKKIEIGNVNMPLNNTLMQGAQNLFGIKTQLQFGKLYVTGVASTQRGTREELKISGGSQKRNFEIRADNYEDNRHFFLSHFFRENYEQALRSIPNPTSGVQIPQNRVEVYVVNRTNNTDALRSIIGLTDLGESKLQNLSSKKVTVSQLGRPSDNKVNSLIKFINTPVDQRDAKALVDQLIALGLERGTDFERIDGARRLTDRDFTVNSELGYISLNTPLRNDEAIAVAYQYTYQGRPFKVGELTEDYQDLNEKQVVLLKLLRPNAIRTNSPMWDLMMKNIYPLGASGINRDNFQLRIVYRDDNTGLDNPNLQEGFRTRNIPLLQLFNMDLLNPNNDPQPDGNFDFIEGITIDSRYGRIIFPVLEPFGSHLNSKFEASENTLIDKYVFQELYDRTKADAQLTAGKNKFFIVGQYQASGAEGVNLNAIGIAPGSVRVTYGSQTLVEGVDYDVDYTTGDVRFLREEYLNASSDIKITYEKDEFFTSTTKRLLGTRLDYKWNKNLNIGGTLLYLNEQPMISRISVGDEPIRNMMWGADVNYSKDSRILTRMVDRLPFIRTKEISNISAMGEFAQLVPGTSNKNGGEGIAYIDDFEGTETPYDLGRQPQTSWKLAATPAMFRANNAGDSLSVGYRRAKLAWYSIEQTTFYRGGGNRLPDNIGENETSDNSYTRAIGYNEVLKGLQETTLPMPQPIFDLAYFPKERGPYNYNPNLEEDGSLPGPGRNNWAGITRAITNDIDFDNINVEYIEFWLMDPFIDGPNGRVIVRGNEGTNNNDAEGKLIFNLGNISEDVIDDDQHMFENGLPPDGTGETRTSIWGRSPGRAYLNNAFENGTGARANQDVGLDGLNNAGEQANFADYLAAVEARVTNEAVKAAIQQDPSGDDFEYFLGDSQDSKDAKIIGRYKNFNNVEGNSPEQTNTNSQYTSSSTNTPDNEDLNRDNTLNELDEYYQYEIPINRANLNLDNRYIADIIKSEHGENWYLFRIPIREPSSTVGNIQGFKSMRFIRTILTGFDNPVVFRMLNFQMVSSQWRKFADHKDYEKLRDPGVDKSGDLYNPSFVVSTVNIEENGTSTGIPYVLPPGFRRDRDNSSLRDRKLNEQSLRLCLDGLKDGDARAVFKNVNFDFLNYKKLKMNLHAQSDDQNVKDDDLTAFIRLGTDQFDNFYEIEIPLKLTRKEDGSTPEVIWPEENLIDISFTAISDVKVERNASGQSSSIAYSKLVGKHRVTVMGNPDYTSVQVVMIGIRNPETPNDESPKSVCIWANELRVSDFDNTAGWAATGRINMKLADFATVTASGRMSTYGFGGIQDRVSERTREDSKQYFISSNINLDKFFPAKLGLKIPMFVSYENEVKTPKYDPLDRDVTVEKSITRFSEESKRQDYLKLIQDRRITRSINFTNVGKVKTKEGAKTHLYDIENLSFTYAYSDEKRSTENIEGFSSKTIKYGVAYNYSNNPKYFEPFKKAKIFGSPFLKAIKDFNIGLGPSTITVRGDLDRRFAKTLYRNSNSRQDFNAPNFTQAYYQKAFTFTRNYDMRWNITKNLAVDYTALAYAIIDEPGGEINTQENRDSVMVNLMKFGRIKDFDQKAAVTYKLPLDKFPVTDWVDAQYRFAVGYHWMAGAISPRPGEKGQADTLGNIISNDREQSLIAKINLTTLYNKNKFLKDLNKPAPRNQPAKNVPPKPQSKEDTVKQKPVRDYKFLKEVLRLMTTVKSLDLNYTVTEQTTLPGFLPKPTNFGMNQNYTAPGWDFVFGNQNPGIRNRVAENGWLAPSGYQTNPFEQIRSTKIALRAQLEPIKDFKIQLDAFKENSENYSEIFRYGLNEIREIDPESGDTILTLQRTDSIKGFSPTRSGNFSISIVSIRTAFDKQDGNNQTKAFKNFVKYRAVIQSRMEVANPNNDGFYGENSQDVLVPAFLAAYTGQSANGVSLSSFPKIPIPNWRIDYTGLGKMDLFKSTFSSFVINHQYVSKLTIGNFVSAYDYSTVPYLNDGFNYPYATEWDDSTRSYIPFYVFHDVTIDEQFSPLIGVNFRTKKRMTGKVEYRTSRAVGLNLSTQQITEQNRKEFVFSFGYTTTNFKIPFKIEGKTVVLKNDLNFRCDVSVSDTKTTQMIIDDVATVTQGNMNVQIRPNVSYAINQRLQLQMYFERGINTPKVSTSYKRTTTAFGAQLRFSLAQ